MSEEAWPELAEHGRIASIHNISRHVEAHGKVDAQLATLLTANDEIIETGTADED